MCLCCTGAVLQEDWGVAVDDDVKEWWVGACLVTAGRSGSLSRTSPHTSTTYYCLTSPHSMVYA